MNLGIGVNLTTTYQPIPTVALDPDAAIAALFGSGEEGAWYDPSDSSTVWQDAAGTTPAGVGDPVGRIDDKSGNGNHATQTTSAARPVLQSSGGLYYLDFDGVDDWIGSAAFASTQAQPNSIGVGFKYDDYTSKIYDFIYDSPDAISRHAAFDQSNNLHVGTGTATINLSNSTTNNEILFSHYNTVSSTFRRNGIQVNTGNVGLDPWSGVWLGRYQANVNWKLNGRIYSFVGVNRTLTAGEITDLETYLASKSGVTLP